MNKQELIEEIEDLKDLKELFGNNPNYIEIDTVIRLISKLDEPQLLKLKDIIARIKGFDSGTRKVWLDGILNELGSDYGTLKYKDGYEQGKFEASMIPYEEPKKVTIPQFIADLLEFAKLNDWDLEDVFEDVRNEPRVVEISKWFYQKNNMDILALAWILGYEVEKKKLFKVRLKGTSQYLCNDDTGLHFQHGFKTDFTKEYLKQAGFGWVFDCEGIEVEEVE